MESVWVVRRRDLFPECTPHGFVPLAPAELEARYLEPARRGGFFVERRFAETNPEWKQIISYCVVRFEGEYLWLERLPAQSERRLHGQLSIGVGGHINPIDASSNGAPASGAAADADLIARGARRELEEELVIGPEFDLAPIGLVNDERSPVGAVHVGIVYGVTATHRPHVRETSKMKGAWGALADIRNMCQTPRPFESWSAEILRSQGWETSF